MKNVSKLLFALNNTNKNENFVIDLTEIHRNEKTVKKLLDRLVFSPRQKVVDDILKFARDGKI